MELEAHPEIFGIWLQALHHNEVITHSPEVAANLLKRFMVLREVYCLATKLQDPETMNLVMREVVAALRSEEAQNLDSKSVIRMVESIYEATDEDYKLRNIMADRFCPVQ
jgi:hypothetical protein